MPRIPLVAGLWLLAGLVLLAVGGAGVAAAGVISAPTPAEVPAADRPPASPSAQPLVSRPVVPEHVRYEILGPPSAGLIRFTRGRQWLVEAPPPMTLPWRSEFDARPGDIPTVTAQNAGDGAITCRITVEGTVVSEVTSEGPHAVATCTGTVIPTR